MGYGKWKKHFQGEKFRYNYNGPEGEFYLTNTESDDITEVISLEKNSTNMSLNNSISFSSHFHFETTEAMKGHVLQFEVWNTQNPTAKNLN